MHSLKKKRFTIPIGLILVVSLLNLVKHPFVVYLPFGIPGPQAASTIPPFGIFIESDQKKTDESNWACSYLTHEMVHWEQYKRMGLVSFHYNYLSLYFKSGRKNHWMEEEASEPCRKKGR
jgi:hypothetical protein